MLLLAVTANNLAALPDSFFCRLLSLSYVEFHPVKICK